jgi:5,10-methylenetetrahydromethanopterin reductase
MSSRADFEFCLNFLTDLPLATLRELWQGCEAAGIEHVGIADSPMLVTDTIATAAFAAANTSRIGLMTAVTNPVSRDPSVMAGALATLAEIAPGRIRCGIGSGDSALWTVGLKPARVARVVEYVTAVQAILRGEEARFEGRSFKAAWKHLDPPLAVPIYVACAGPRLLRAAAQVADGLIIFMGFSEQNLALVKRTIEEACAETGRDPAGLKLWWQTTITFAPTVEEAMERSLGVNTSWMTAGTVEGKQIPPEYIEPLRRFNRDMEDAAATYGASDRGRVLVERAKALGLYEWLTGLAPGFWGPPENVARRLREFGDQGMTNWMFYVAQFHGDRFEYLDRFARGVLPALESAPG